MDRGALRGLVAARGRARVSATVTPPFAPVRGLVGLAVGTDHKGVALRLRRRRVRLLPGRRRARAAHARRAGPAGDAGHLARRLRPALLDARLDDDLPLRHAGRARAGHLPRAAAGRRRGDRVAAAEPRSASGCSSSAALVMWSGFLTRDGAGSAAWTGEYPQSAAVRTPGHRDGPVVRRGRCSPALGRHRAGRLPAGHHRRAPRARDDAAADAGLHVVDARDLPDGRSRASRRSCWPWRCCWPTATAPASSTRPAGPTAYQNLFWFYGHPVVYVMFFPFLGAVLEVVATFSRPALLRLPRDRHLAARLHRAVDERLGPSHVHHRAGGQRLLLADLDDAGRPGRARVLRR